jgi:predicted MFS family arabinose efflux permease
MAAIFDRWYGSEDAASGTIFGAGMFVVTVLWSAFFLVNFNIAMMIPLIPFVQASLGLSTLQAGWVLAAFPITALVSNLVLGPWIDRFGRKRFLVTGSAACCVIFLLTAAANNATTLIICRAAIGLFMPMLGASVFAAIADYVEPEDQARIAGYVTTAAPIAFLLSMSLGMVLGGLVSWQVPLLLAAAVAGTLALCAARLPPTPHEALSTAPLTIQTYRSRLLSLSMNAETRLLFLGYFCWSAAVFIFLGLYPSWIVQHGLAGHSPGAIGVMLFLGEVGGLLGALFAGRLSKLFSQPLSLCALAAFATAAVVAIVPFGNEFLAFQALAYGSFAFGRDMMLALILGGAMLLVPATQRGSLNSILNAIYQTGSTTGALASAWAYGLRPDFIANAAGGSILFVVSGVSLWQITRPMTVRRSQ